MIVVPAIYRIATVFAPNPGSGCARFEITGSKASVSCFVSDMLSGGERGRSYPIPGIYPCDTVRANPRFLYFSEFKWKCPGNYRVAGIKP